MSGPLKPKDILSAQVTAVLVPSLSPLGFVFARSSLTLWRKVGYVKQSITFSLNRHNTSDSIDFWTGWDASCPAYTKWHLEEWGEKPPNDVLHGTADWNIPGWRYPQRRPTSYHFDLSEPHRRNEEMAALRANAVNLGLPYLERVSTWEGAADYILNHAGPVSAFEYAKACDFYLVAGRRDLAMAALERSQPRMREEDEDLRRRMAKYLSA